MVGITVGSLIQFMFLITVWQNIPLSLMPVEYMLSRHHVRGFSVLGVSETFQSNYKMFKDKNYYSFLRHTTQWVAQFQDYPVT